MDLPTLMGREAQKLIANQQVLLELTVHLEDIFNPPPGVPPIL